MLQVIVFIHGGAFILGSYTTYGPHHLLVTDERVTRYNLQLVKYLLLKNLNF